MTQWALTPFKQNQAEVAAALEMAFAEFNKHAHVTERVRTSKLRNIIGGYAKPPSLQPVSYQGSHMSA